MSLDDDTGTATISAAGVIAALVAMALLIAVLARGMIHAHQAQVTAELSAVSAAHALYRGEDACAHATAVASRNIGACVACRVAESDVLVTIRVGDKEVTARAGPLG